jgi:hypothetical protein
VGRIWEILEMLVRENIEWCKQSLMSNSGGSSEDQNADRNMHNKDCACNISDVNWAILRVRIRGYGGYKW